MLVIISFFVSLPSIHSFIHSFIQTMQVQNVSPAINLEANKNKRKAEIYDAAMVLLKADRDLALTDISLATITNLSELCRKIELGEKVSGSPLLDF